LLLALALAGAGAGTVVLGAGVLGAVVLGAVVLGAVVLGAVVLGGVVLGAVVLGGVVLGVVVDEWVVAVVVPLAANAGDAARGARATATAVPRTQSRDFRITNTPNRRTAGYLVCRGTGSKTAPRSFPPGVFPIPRSLHPSNVLSRRH